MSSKPSPIASRGHSSIPVITSPASTPRAIFVHFRELVARVMFCPARNRPAALGFASVTTLFAALSPAVNSSAAVAPPARAARASFIAAARAVSRIVPRAARLPSRFAPERANVLPNPAAANLPTGTIEATPTSVSSGSSPKLPRPSVPSARNGVVIADAAISASPPTNPFSSKCSIAAPIPMCGSANPVSIPRILRDNRAPSELSVKALSIAPSRREDVNTRCSKRSHSPGISNTPES